MLCALRPVMIWIGLFGRFCGRFGFCGWVFGGFGVCLFAWWVLLLGVLGRVVLRLLVIVSDMIDCGFGYVICVGFDC